MCMCMCVRSAAGTETSHACNCVSQTRPHQTDADESDCEAVLEDNDAVGDDDEVEGAS